MVKDKKWDEFTATYEDADGDEHESKTLVHFVTDDTKGEVVTIDGSVRQTKAGDVLCPTSKANVYDVLTADQWKTSDYAGSSDKADKADKDDTLIVEDDKSHKPIAEARKR